MSTSIQKGVDTSTAVINFFLQSCSIPFDNENSPHFLTLVLEATHPSDGPEKVNTGAEYWFNKILALRAGYRFNYDEESFTFGAGVKYGFGNVAGRVDYAFADFGLLEQVHMFILGIDF